MAFNLSTGKTAYVPLGNATGVGGLAFKDPMFRCHYTFSDITFTVIVPNAPSSPAIFYFGDPEPDSVALEDLTGVLGTASLTQGSTAGVMSTSINFSLPEGRIMLTGVYSYVSANYSIVSFPVSTGKVLSLFNSNKIGNETIHPIAVEGSQSFAINISTYVNANATNTMYVILYYTVLSG
ncbi:MAG: hypothetical protein QXE51_04900 [Nitrososphaeria archaeon]